LKTQRPNQPDDAKEVVGMEMGEEDLGQREAHAIPHHLALRAFPTFE
jgi:hypothetical protein